MNNETKIPGLTEQDYENPEKWIVAVLNLLKLTQHKELVWQRLRDIPDVVGIDEYRAFQDAAILRLRINRETKYMMPGYSFTVIQLPNQPEVTQGSWIGRQYPMLQIYSDAEDYLFEFPDIAPLDALAQAVVRQEIGPRSIPLTTVSDTNLLEANSAAVLSKFTNKIAQLSDENAHLKDEVSRLRDENAYLKAENSRRTEPLKEVQLELRTLTQEIKMLRTERESKIQ